MSDFEKVCKFIDSNKNAIVIFNTKIHGDLYAKVCDKYDAQHLREYSKTQETLLRCDFYKGKAMDGQVLHIQHMILLMVALILIGQDISCWT